MTQTTKELIRGYKLKLRQCLRELSGVYDMLNSPVDITERHICEIPESDKAALNKELDALNELDNARGDLRDAIGYVDSAIEGLRKATR